MSSMFDENVKPTICCFVSAGTFFTFEFSQQTQIDGRQSLFSKNNMFIFLPRTEKMALLKIVDETSPFKALQNLNFALLEHFLFVKQRNDFLSKMGKELHDIFKPRIIMAIHHDKFNERLH